MGITCLKPGAWFEGRERSFLFSDRRGRSLHPKSTWSYIANAIQSLEFPTGCSFEYSNYASCLKGAGCINILVRRRPVRVKSCFHTVWEYIDCLIRYRDEVFGYCDSQWQDQRLRLREALLAESYDVWTER